MKKLGAALLTLWLAYAAPAFAENTVGPTNQVICNKFAIQSASTAALVSIVPGVANQSIFICGWHVTNSAASGTFTLSQGTGTNCVTTNTVLTPAFNVSSTAPSTDHISYATIGLTQGNNLCIISSGITLQIEIWYSQF